MIIEWDPPRFETLSGPQVRSTPSFQSTHIKEKRLYIHELLTDVKVRGITYYRIEY